MTGTLIFAENLSTVLKKLPKFWNYGRNVQTEVVGKVVLKIKKYTY